MFIIFLRFSSQKEIASSLMEAHRVWVTQGFADGVFLLAGSLVAEGGGAIVAAGSSQEALHKRIAEDPFVEAGVVAAELHEVEVAKADQRLAFLLES